MAGDSVYCQAGAIKLPEAHRWKSARPPVSDLPNGPGFVHHVDLPPVHRRRALMRAKASGWFIGQGIASSSLRISASHTGWLVAAFKVVSVGKLVAAIRRES